MDNNSQSSINNVNVSDVVPNLTGQDIDKPKNRKVWLLCMLVFVVILIGAFLVYRKLNQKTLDKNVTISIVDDSLRNDEEVVERMAFYELTVPYLRDRKYDSKLGDLERIDQNSNYTSFKSSYDSEGYKINGLLTKPIGTMPEGGFPAIVFIHGYIPPAQYVTTEKYVEYVDYLASNGFVVFKIDLRGHGDSEGESGGGYYGSDYVIDALNATAALSGTDFVNPKRIGYWGHSMAGNTIMRAMAARPNSPAGVIWAGAVYTYLDMQKYSISDSSYQPPVNNVNRQQKRREMFEKYGTPSAESEFWHQVAPSNYLSDLTGAIEIHHAVDDNVVDIGYSRDLDILLDEAGVDHVLHEYPSGGHNISGPSFSIAMQRSVEFFKKYLR